MIVDSHQHFVRLAKHPEVEGFREAQLAGRNPDELPQLSDADVNKNLQAVLGLMTQRNIDMAFASPRAKAMATHDGTVEQNGLWADLNNSLVLRACQLNPGKFAPVGMLGQHQTCPSERIAKQMEKWAGEGFVAFNFDPDGTGGRWSNPPFTGKHNYPVFAAAEALDVPLVLHGSESINPNFPHTAVQYLVADIEGFVQLMMAKDLFKDFPRLRFLIPHAGGALPCQIGRWRAIAKFYNWSSPDEILGSGNVFVDTCVYNHLEHADAVRGGAAGQHSVRFRMRRRISGHRESGDQRPRGQHPPLRGRFQLKQRRQRPGFLRQLGASVSAGQPLD